MAKESNIVNNPVPSLLTEVEYTALLPALKKEYDKVYGVGKARRHHVPGYTQAKKALNVTGSLRVKEKLRS
jgi:hypothetical protein